MNPAVSIGVWISEKRYVHNLLFLISISLFQFLGALLALFIGYIMRVTVTDPETGGKYLVPNVYTSAAPLLLTTDGMPSYGQIMLSETIGTFIFVLTSLSARDYMKRNRDGSGVI